LKKNNFCVIFYHDLLFLITCVIECVTEGPQAMIRGAVMYGGLMYFLSGGAGTGFGFGKKQPFQYEEQEIEF
jgi:hypothetical protein